MIANPSRGLFDRVLPNVANLEFWNHSEICFWTADSSTNF